MTISMVHPARLPTVISILYHTYGRVALVSVAEHIQPAAVETQLATALAPVTDRCTTGPAGRLPPALLSWPTQTGKHN